MSGVGSCKLAVTTLDNCTADNRPHIVGHSERGIPFTPSICERIVGPVFKEMADLRMIGCRKRCWVFAKRDVRLVFYTVRKSGNCTEFSICIKDETSLTFNLCWLVSTASRGDVCSVSVMREAAKTARPTTDVQKTIFDTAPGQSHGGRKTSNCRSMTGLLKDIAKAISESGERLILVINL